MHTYLLSSPQAVVKFSADTAFSSHHDKTAKKIVNGKNNILGNVRK